MKIAKEIEEQVNKVALKKYESLDLKQNEEDEKWIDKAIEYYNDPDQFIII